MPLKNTNDNNESSRATVSCVCCGYSLILDQGFETLCGHFIELMFKPVSFYFHIYTPFLSPELVSYQATCTITEHYDCAGS